MNARGCNTYLGGMRVQRSDDLDDVFKTKPDIVVHCSPVPKGTYIKDPVIVVEVLSPSTMDIDRGPKLDFYKSLSTVMYVATVYTDQMRIEFDHRTPDGWERDILKTGADILRFESVAFRLELAQIYFGTELV